MSGAPKSSTLKLISESEGEERGFYTGVFGYFNGYSLDSAVLIRFIERAEDGRMFYRSGGGVTINSTCTEEYDEIMKKIYIPKV
ncbi:Anthranilate synthase component 1 [bioreactor metagenome]|uniref:Anthranilate synthase component 1 n=1 Tax=bioreactor metagenome TaxID=1076179 RepID=A0A645DLB7_9ZZZZ